MYSLSPTDMKVGPLLTPILQARYSLGLPDSTFRWRQLQRNVEQAQFAGFSRFLLFLSPSMKDAIRHFNLT